MSQVILLRAAKADMLRAARFYEEQAEKLGSDFVTEVQQAFELLAQSPYLGAPLRHGARRLRVKRFPYLVIYRLEADKVIVLAVGHQRRHPDFWLGRLRS